MARRLFEPLECYPHVESKRPAIPVTLSTLSGQRVVDRRPMLVDTGFAGSILLEQEIFLRFERAELPESESRLYRPLTGTIPMRTARAILKLPITNEIETLVETPRYGVGKSLIGLQALNKLQLVLRGTNSESCILSEKA